MSPRKSRGPTFREFTGLSEEQENRLKKLLNYAKFKATIEELNEIKTLKKREIDENQVYLNSLEESKSPNKILIYTVKKRIAEKVIEYDDINKELSTLKKYSIKDKPENTLREINSLLGPNTKSYTQIRTNFVTAVLTRGGQLKFNYEFGITGRSILYKQGIRSKHEAILETIALYKKIADEHDGTRKKFVQIKQPFMKWKGSADAQTMGQANPIMFDDILKYWILLLEQVSRLPKITDVAINNLAKKITKGTGIDLQGSITIRYKIEKSVVEEIAEGTFEEGKIRKVKRKKPFSFPGEKATKFDINGGLS